MFLKFYAWNGTELNIALDAIQLIKLAESQHDPAYYIFLEKDELYKLYKSLNPEVFETLTKYLEENCLK